MGDLGLLSDIADSRDLYLPAATSEGLLLSLLVAGTFVVTRKIAGRLPAITLSAVSVMAFVFDGHVFIPIGILLAVSIALVRPVRVMTPPSLKLHRELAVIVAGYGAYEIGRLISRSESTVAFQNARRVTRLQNSLWLPRESVAQRYLLPHADLTRIANLVYSHAFLATVVGVLIWLFYSDERNYRIYRNALAISAIFTIVISWLFPVAPPRLVATDVIDTQVLMGGQHGFINEYAAVPSLHVGWTALAGLMIARSLGSWKGALSGMALPLLIGITVIVTGNHFWIDGVIGIAIAVGPAYLMIKEETTNRTLRSSLAHAVRITDRTRHHATQLISQNPTLVLTSLMLGGLLNFLLVGQIVAKGFTDHWGYLVAQVALTLLLVIAFELAWQDGRLVFPITHVLIITATALDVFGTTEDLYANYAFYDKIVHCIGTAAFTAVVLDILVGLRRRYKLQWSVERIAVVSFLTGAGAGVLWEVYELVGDTVFNSARIGGIEDTAFDLIFDTLGAIAVAAAWHWIQSSRTADQPWAKLPSSPYPSGFQGDTVASQESYVDDFE